MNAQAGILKQMAMVEAQAWTDWARYKFWSAGYHAGKWVTFNHLLGELGYQKQPNPFGDLVRLAKAKASMANARNGRRFGRVESTEGAQR